MQKKNFSGRLLDVFLNANGETEKYLLFKKICIHEILPYHL